jgi:hypothetical protein
MRKRAPAKLWISGGGTTAAEPQAGEEHLVEGADINHALGLVEALQGSERPAGVAVFAVVIVLDDPAARLARPGEQLEPPRHRQHDAERILVRGSDEGGAGSWRRTPARAHVEALRVDGDGTQRDAGRRQRPARHRVAGILDPDFIARRKQHPYGNVDRVLGARGDDDLLRARAHAARGAEIIADGAAQLRQSARVGIAAVDRIEAAKHLLGEPAPDLDGARVDEHARIGERAVFVFDGNGAERGEGARLR